MAVVAGGTIPIGKDTTAEIDETWVWARSPKPLILELQPKIDTGTVTLTLGSEAGTFSTAPTVSVAGWFIRVKGRDEWFRIASHTASATAFEIDGIYPDATTSTLGFEVVKLDYDLLPEYIVIDSTNNKVQFQETTGTTLTATLTAGSYTPSALATEIQTQMNTTGGTPVYTVTYSATTRKFTIASDRGGGAVFILVGTGDQANIASAHPTLGFDDENTSNAASATGTYPIGLIARLIEPIKIHKGSAREGSIYGIGAEVFQRNNPFSLMDEGTPDKFTVIKETAAGVLTVRFNRWVKEKTRIEVEYVPLPRDLKDNSTSTPLVPRKWVDLLVNAATFMILLDKSDDKMQIFSSLVQGNLKAMIAQHRGSQVRTGKNFGQLIPRRENVRQYRKNLAFGDSD